MANDFRKVQNITEMIQRLNDFANRCETELQAISQTAFNLGILALNANIEAIHAANFLDDFEKIISENMLIQARMVAVVLEKNIIDSNSGMIEQLTHHCGIERIFITDKDASVIYTNVSGLLQKRLSNSHLFKKPDGTFDFTDKEFVLPKEPLMDGRYQKTVLVPRQNNGGIIQIEFIYEPPRGRLTIDSFSVVAEEVRRQAKRFELATQKTTQICDSMKELIAIAENAGGDHDLLTIRDCCKKVLPMLNEIMQIAKLTNLLGIRAKIEAAQSANYIGDFDKLLNIQMIVEAKICYHFFPDGELSYDDAMAFTDTVGLEEVWISNKDGIVEITNSKGGKGFQYTNKGQTAPFMLLLENSNAVVTCAPARRALDGKIVKYVGIQRRNGGILQIGRKAELYGENTATGFMFVADEVKVMSEKTKVVTTEMIDMFEGMISQLADRKRKYAV